MLIALLIWCITNDILSTAVNLVTKKTLYFNMLMPGCTSAVLRRLQNGFGNMWVFQSLKIVVDTTPAPPHRRV
jgi:hypothetical protein